ncbi:hypothetical protein VKT23_012914 [Stygiomarasmius scandens]|uniref:SET domain-containing protein n=1 Tax=Marasmiellus scandens TaxID=2682957 RepID=A0ABR1J5D4_9AGAR
MAKALPPKRMASDTSDRKKTSSSAIKVKPAFIEKTDGNTSWLELPDSDSEYEHEESHINDAITAPRVSKVSSAQSSKKGKKNSKVLPPDQRRITSFFVPQMKVNHTKLSNLPPCTDSTNTDADRPNQSIVGVSKESHAASALVQSSPPNTRASVEHIILSPTSATVHVVRTEPFRSKERFKSNILWEQPSPRPGHTQTLPAQVQSTTTPSGFLARPSRVVPKPIVRDEKLLRIERDWNEKARAAGAAEITIINDIDGTPPVDENFIYYENARAYNTDNQLPSFARLKRSLPKANCPSCKKNKSCSQDCECDVMLVFHDDDFKNIHPYDDDGFFQFNVPQGGIVMECNPKCPCNKRVCVNSVAQHPRSVPIEVFKTQDRGWGVRSSAFVKRGTVLGIYTGDLIHRSIAEGLEGEKATYVFDLDTDEDLESDSSGDKYSVDASSSGNWTRFINHSCSPNLQIYSAAWETRVDMGMQNLVFVAKQNIKAGIEFTFDYDPEQADDAGDPPEGAIPCLCRTEKCRGWVRAPTVRHHASQQESV